MRFFRFRSALRVFGIATVLGMALLLIQQPAPSQAISMNGGSIQGTVTDPGGAVVAGAKITISNSDTGFSRSLASDSAGLYSIGPLLPGRYTITVDATGFAHEVIKTVVSTGTVSSGNVTLKVGSAGETVEVSAGEVQVNTDQAGVAGVVTQAQINTLPINGRNILDIAQVQPGVMLQSGQDFDPTKTGYSALALNGQNGRTTRILVDGQDITDETVGTVIFNVPEGAISEFQLNRSTQDVSGEVTSTGQVLMSTYSGTNRFHGNLFGIFQDARAGFAGINGLAGDDSPFQRNQFGGYLGGPIWKDRLFFFGGAERIKQFDSSPVNVLIPVMSAIYAANPNVPDPFKDTFSMGRLDWSGPWGMHYFARATYSNNTGSGTSGQDPYGLFANQDNVPSLVGGADFTTGNFTHSLRYGYLKFINNLNSNSAGVYNPSDTFGFPVEIGVRLGGSRLFAGGNENAPQKTYQSSKQFRYDGTWTKGAHNLKYGGEITRILQGGFAAFISTMLAESDTTNPRFQLAQCATTADQAIGGIDSNGQCLDDPFYGYKPYLFLFGNGNGSGSERPAFGLPGGGNFSWRLAAYIGDTWKIKPYLTLVAGLRWSTDTDRADQDLPTPTCGQVDAALQFDGCDSAHSDTPLFDFFGPGLGLGKRTHQPYANFGPQLGLVFSPGNHRYSLRGGIGIYYESNIFNNQGNVRAQNTPAEFPAFTDSEPLYSDSTENLNGWVYGVGGVMQNGDPCNIGGASDAGCIGWPELFNMSTADATIIMEKLVQKYQAASAVPQPNGSFIGHSLEASSAYGGPYKTPYSLQVNGGVQYELKRGLLLNVDYIHNATLRVPLSLDVNHVGAARFLNITAAQNAIAAALSDCGADSIDGAIAKGCTIDDFASEGLGSGAEYLNGVPASNYGISASYGAAFPGANTNVGVGSFILPVGKSAYDALQVVLQQQKQHPFPGILASNAQISYNLSQAVSNSGGGSNEFFAGAGPFNQDNVNKYIGRNDADHTSMLSLAGSFTVKHGLQIALIGHFFSADATTLTLANAAGATGAGQIFKTDVDGDGTTSDLVPGTGPGTYMHEVKGSGLEKLIANYNTSQAGTLTPAGQALVDAGLFTPNQLVELGAVKPQLAPAPANPLKNPATRTLDASVRYPISLSRFREGFVITPSATFYNVTNMANYSGFSGLAVPGADATGQLNGENSQDILDSHRTLRGSGNGTFDQGGPRSAEFSLKIEF